jgi:small subunit ribosomal protein S2
VDIRREHNAVAEARKLKVPVVALVDTNCDPDLVTFPIAANDDAIRSIRVILTAVGEAVTVAQAEFESKRPRKTVEEAAPAEAQTAEAAPTGEVPPVITETALQAAT